MMQLRMVVATLTLLLRTVLAKASSVTLLLLLVLAIAMVLLATVLVQVQVQGLRRWWMRRESSSETVLGGAPLPGPGPCHPLPLPMRCCKESDASRGACSCCGGCAPPMPPPSTRRLPAMRSTCTCPWRSRERGQGRQQQAVLLTERARPSKEIPRWMDWNLGSFEATAGQHAQLDENLGAACNASRTRLQDVICVHGELISSERCASSRIRARSSLIRQAGGRTRNMRRPRPIHGRMSPPRQLLKGVPPPLPQT